MSGRRYRLLRSWPLRGRAARAPFAARRDTRLPTLTWAPLLAATRPGRSGPVRCSAGYPPPDAHFGSALGRYAAGPLGPRSLLGGIPASRRSLGLRSWPLRGRAARAPFASRPAPRPPPPPAAPLF